MGFAVVPQKLVDLLAPVLAVAMVGAQGFGNVGAVLAEELLRGPQGDVIAQLLSKAKGTAPTAAQAAMLPTLVNGADWTKILDQLRE